MSEGLPDGASNAALDINAGAEALGLPSTLPTAETAPENTTSSQAGLPVTTTRLESYMPQAGAAEAPAGANSVVDPVEAAEAIQQEAVSVAKAQVDALGSTGHQAGSEAVQPAGDSLLAPTVEDKKATEGVAPATRVIPSPYLGAGPATPEQIANAAKYGFDLNEHNAKYYPSSGPK